MNICVFIGYPNQIPIFLGLFGKANLIYESKFDQSSFDSDNKQIYYHKKLNTKFYFYREDKNFLNEDDSFFESFDNSLFFLESLNPNAYLLFDKVDKIKNKKILYVWHYGEVFHKDIYSVVEKRNYNLILSGSKRPELETYENYVFDPLLPFRYFRYYIGYYWLEDLLNKLEPPKYDKTIPKLFSYIRAYSDSSWRTEYINKINGLIELLTSKDSANDAYDLLYPKYKHFEAINDYLYCNFNLIFETINPYNNSEWFLTEKTFKGLFFGKPFLLIAPYSTLNFLREKGFFILNFEFNETIQSSVDVQNSIQNFVNWINSTNDKEIETKYNEFLEKSKNNRKVLFEYLNDYSQSEKIFQTLIN